jgi:hypothetical protein
VRNIAIERDADPYTAGLCPAPTIHFDLDDHGTPETFWNLPFPNDLRLTDRGAPDLAAFPNPRGVPILESLLSNVEVRHGWPTMATAYFRFTAPVPARSIDDVIEFDAEAPVMLLDISHESPEFGTRFPVVAKTLATDPYVPSDLVALAPRPGIVLRPNTQYAYVIRDRFAPGFAPPATYAQLRDGGIPDGPLGEAAAEVFAPLWAALDEWSIDDAIVGTVFTTGDEIARLHARTEGVRAAHSPVVENLALVGGSAT